MKRRINSKSLRSLIQVQTPANNPGNEIKEKLTSKLKKVRLEKEAVIAVMEQKINEALEKISKVDSIQDSNEISKEYQEVNNWLDYLEKALLCFKNQMQLTNDNFLVKQFEKLGVYEVDSAARNGILTNGLHNGKAPNGSCLENVNGSVEDVEPAKKQKLLIDGKDEDDGEDLPIKRGPDVPMGNRTVVACYVDNPSSFWLHYDPNKAVDVGHKLQVAQNAILRKGDWHLNCVKEGVVCAAVYSKDGYYYRAKIIKVHQDPKSIIPGKEETLTMDVYYLDYGNVETRNYNEVMKLDPAFKRIPPQAAHCTLNLSVKEAEWSEETISKFKRILYKEELEALFCPAMLGEENMDLIYTVNLSCGSTSKADILSLLPKSEWSLDRIDH